MGHIATMPGHPTDIFPRFSRQSLVLLASLAAAVLTQPAVARIAAPTAPRKPAGAYVIPMHADFELRDERGNVVVGTDRFEYFQVERSSGSRLWLRSASCWGWINADQVVPVDSAIEFFSRAIKDHPDDSYAYTARGVVWEAFRQDFGKAVADFTESIRLNPRDPGAYNFRGWAFYLKQDYDRAIADFNHAIRFDPEEAIAFHNRGLVWLAKKDTENALADFTDAIRLAPESPVAYLNRGRVWSDQKYDYVLGLADYDRAIQLSPQYARAYNSRAWLLATCPEAKHRDGKEAVASATRGCELTSWKDPLIIDTLAAAYAEAGDFDSAARWQSRAIEFLSDASQKAEYRTRLKLYQEKKPYHQPKPP